MRSQISELNSQVSTKSNVNAPTTFERPNGIIVEGKSFDSHMKTLKQVFQKLRNFELNASPKMALSFQAGFRPSSKTIDHIQSIIVLIEKTVEYNRVMALKFLENASNTIELDQSLNLCNNTE